MGIILASGSPRRRELLKNIVAEFEVIVSDAEENADASLPVYRLVEELAKLKAAAVLPHAGKNDTVIAADTVVWINGKILGKPHTKEEAASMLNELSGSVHRVFTGVYIQNINGAVSFYDETEVEFYKLTTAEIEDYIKKDEPYDKAGSYGIQGPGSVLVKGIKGDYYNVMGFPVARVYRALKELGAL